MNDSRTKNAVYILSSSSSHITVRFIWLLQENRIHRTLALNRPLHVFVLVHQRSLLNDVLCLLDHVSNNEICCLAMLENEKSLNISK